MSRVRCPRVDGAHNGNADVMWPIIIYGTSCVMCDVCEHLVAEWLKTISKALWENWSVKLKL